MKIGGRHGRPRIASGHEQPIDGLLRLLLANQFVQLSAVVAGWESPKLDPTPIEQIVQFIDHQTDLPKIPDDNKLFIWGVDGSGNNLTVFAAHTFFEGVNHAVDWIMVDHDKRDPSIRSMADAKARGLRPYWSHVLGRNVLNVQSRIEGGKEVITYIKILEPGEPQHIREF